MSKALEQGKETAPPPKPLSESCWGCRILSGSVLIGAGVWVYLGSRRVISRGIASSVGNIVQLVFAASECACGVRGGQSVPYLHGNRPTRQSPLLRRNHPS
ncbi:distal membrane-arm assembly complex protein 1 isoform X1 [Trachemys scripta elegans]|uniref:distal membrane-arm assembly complex protein 1 isoform X1 n=1 Tax=Trachemys scripta elegans TaxID=31138 RepID=UPI001554F002|nr:distal membrane-arm assembly complex protein 1 isoform X1 [Trachemys scripta elegans]